MNPRLLLRIAAFLLLVHLIGHTLGHSGWKKNTDPAISVVIQAMTGPKFPFMGVNRSMGDYFDGYGYIASVTLLLLVLICWFASGDTGVYNRIRNQIVLTTGVLSIVISLLEFIFFFPFAGGITLLAGLTALTAGVRLQMSKK